MRKTKFMAAALVALFGSAPAFAGILIGGDNPACAAAAAYSDQHRGIGILVMREGRVVCEAYGDVAERDRPHPIHSGTKSFTGAMAVLAEADGLLQLDEPVSQTITEWAQDERRSITIRQLLSLVGGFETPVGTPPSFSAAITLTPRSAPGSRFSYGPAPFQIFGEVMRRKLVARGEDGDPSAWLQRRLLAPLGIEMGPWRRTPSGDPMLSQGMQLTGANWARFGEWVRVGGRVGSRQIIPERALAAFHQGSTVFPGYALTWWQPGRLVALPADRTPARFAERLEYAGATYVPADLIMAGGAGGQRMYVSRSCGVTIVRFARFDLQAAMQARRGRDLNAAGNQAANEDGIGRASDGTTWSDPAFLRLALQAAVGRQPSTAVRGCSQ
jgi:CubicO group peptidase (beta-lactamase class C family)